MSHIGTLMEGPLHAALKEHYRQPGDRVEHAVDGLVVDIVRDDLLIEVQTGGFTPLRAKLDRLLDDHRVRIVHPVAVDTVITKVDDDGEVLDRRTSPKHETVLDVFAGLVSITDHLARPELEVDVVRTRQGQVRRREPGKAWRRRGWVIQHRSLLEVLGVHELHTPADLRALVPADLHDGFTTVDLREALGTTPRLAGQVAYCLRESGLAVHVGSRGRAHLYEMAA